MVMRLMNNTLTDAMAGNIISVGSELGVDLSASDVKNIAIITLHKIVFASEPSDVKNIKNAVCEIIGNSEKIGDYLHSTLCEITAENDAIINKMISEKRCDLRWWKL